MVMVAHTQFSRFGCLEVDQHSQKKPPFPQMLLRLSLSSVEAKSGCTSN